MPSSLQLILDTENSSQHNIKIFVNSPYEVYIGSDGNFADDFYLKIDKDDWLYLKKFIDSEFNTID